MQLSKSFALKEFASHDGAPFPPDVLTNLQELAKNLQGLRDYLNFPIDVSSGYRSPKHNEAVGGHPNSYHLRGMASDLKCKKYTPSQVHAAILYLIKEGKMKEGGVGLYNTFVHYDIQGVKKRWDKRTKK